ncbi:DUF4846 domain-containing protein [Caldicoprobacter algeriensis]|uniref:DUF4846 domain-containing protein n=1 Tax=Caldicoprobacter algeriensis TaxID=699281 RepID=UPI0020793E72|nr:DUF4846 domain-containing protein [Caldicoprobacter algeriensis]MCM8899934.1 DUF4846 domain-containing protein [Caldicoprobacter algeriensis]
MKKLLFIILIVLLFVIICQKSPSDKKTSNMNSNVSDKSLDEQNSSTSTSVTNPNNQQHSTSLIINPSGRTIEDRINLPKGFERIKVEEGSFGHYLRTLPLKPHGSKVKYYDGREKGHNVYEAVIDMDIGDKDLQQCADAVIRLRAEYLYKHKQYDRIHFNFTNGFNAQFVKWAQGYRISVSGNKVSWVKSFTYSDDYSTFSKYLDMVFSYAGTLSLAEEMKPVMLEDMEIGDVFIQGGSPGHCAIVVDMAVHPQTGEKLFMLAQSYMPAQDIHILKNPQDPQISPWYSIEFGDTLITPEWTFKKTDLKRFSN